jgi:hypothetical protein
MASTRSPAVPNDLAAALQLLQNAPVAPVLSSFDAPSSSGGLNNDEEDQQEGINNNGNDAEETEDQDQQQQEGRRQTHNNKNKKKNQQDADTKITVVEGSLRLGGHGHFSFRGGAHSNSEHLTPESSRPGSGSSNSGGSNSNGDQPEATASLTPESARPGSSDAGDSEGSSGSSSSGSESGSDSGSSGSGSEGCACKCKGSCKKRRKSQECCASVVNVKNQETKLKIKTDDGGQIILTFGAIKPILDRLMPPPPPPPHFEGPFDYEPQTVDRLKKYPAPISTAESQASCSQSKSSPSGVRPFYFYFTLFCLLVANRFSFFRTVVGGSYLHLVGSSSRQG